MWEIQNFIYFSILKKFLARAHFRARALRIFYHLCQKTIIFEFSQRCEIRRARQNFSWKCNLHDKISLQIFLFGHNSKVEFFRAIWSLKIFFEISIFSKKFGSGKHVGKINCSTGILIFFGQILAKTSFLSNFWSVEAPKYYFWQFFIVCQPQKSILAKIWPKNIKKSWSGSC